VLSPGSRDALFLSASSPVFPPHATIIHTARLAPCARFCLRLHRASSLPRTPLTPTLLRFCTCNQQLLLHV
jgi:hypothetical protein